MSYRRFLLPVAVLLIGTLFFSNPASGEETSVVEVDYINVGQGDSALLRDSNGFDVLIDGGKMNAGQTVVEFLREKQVDDLEVVMVSHADADHVGGLIDVLWMNDIQVEKVLYNGYPGASETWGDFAAAVSAEGITLTAAQFPQTFTWGDMTAHVLNPVSGLSNPETNDASLVVMVDHLNNQFLFTGDIDTSIEAEIIARGTPFPSEVLKVAHHGSKYGSSNAFLAAADPQKAIISVGDNSYGHPAQDTIARLESAGAEVYRTDLAGTIVFYSDGSTITSSAPVYSVVKVFLPFIADMILPTVIPTATPELTPTVTPSPTATLQQTQTPRPTSAPPTAKPTNPSSGPCNCSGPDLDCSDFSTHAGAQACFNYCVGQGFGDIFRLDGDNDGRACESLP